MQHRDILIMYANAIEVVYDYLIAELPGYKMIDMVGDVAGAVVVLATEQFAHDAGVSKETIKAATAKHMEKDK